VINGVEKPSHAVTFDDNGQPCLSLNDLTTLGIVAVKNTDAQCINLITTYPQATITTDPGNNKLLFVLPAEAIADSNNLDVSQYTAGGTGAMVNYDLLMMKSNNKSEGDNNNNDLNT
ncbi:FimD/PapC N-terminal domain-containing protein, partial [Moellerella wisconsensis]